MSGIYGDWQSFNMDTEKIFPHILSSKWLNAIGLVVGIFYSRAAVKEFFVTHLHPIATSLTVLYVIIAIIGLGNIKCRKIANGIVIGYVLYAILTLALWRSW